VNVADNRTRIPEQYSTGSGILPEAFSTKGERRGSVQHERLLVLLIRGKEL